LRAYRREAREYHDAFTTPDGKRADSPTAPEMLRSIATLLGESVDDAANSISYIDPDLRLDVADIHRQIAWYQAQGMIKGEVDGDKIIDKRYVVPLPEK
jgi:NitT/TauT family transport system substrate-binding protein